MRWLTHILYFSENAFIPTSSKFEIQIPESYFKDIFPCDNRGTDHRIKQLAHIQKKLRIILREFDGGTNFKSEDMMSKDNRDNHHLCDL